MENNDENDEYLQIDWHIENIHFCWHRTGELLESPSFSINIPGKTSWKLLLYPRGVDDGEYMSCYLFRDDGGPEYVDVDFDLFLFVEDIVVKPMVSFSKIYSFKKYQKGGLGCFASRWEVFAPIASQKDNCTLIVCCRIFNPNIKSCVKVIFTRIEIERVYGTELFDHTDFGPLINKVIDVKPILEDEPLININLLYIEESLVMKICPVNCKDIKYATIKISVIENGEKKSLVQYVSSWIGEIKTATLRYKVYRPDEELATLDIEDRSHKTFLLHYDFIFSTGIVVEKCLFKKYDSNKKFSKTLMQQCLNSNVKKVESTRNALEALEDVYRSASYADFDVVAEKQRFLAHKAILCSRSSKFKSTIQNGDTGIGIPIYSDESIEDFLQFLYTDTVECPSWKMGFQMYSLASIFQVQLLVTKCRKFLLDNLDHTNASFILPLTDTYDDLQMKTVVENYIGTYYEYILSSGKWEDLDRLEKDMLRDLVFSKYKMKK